MTAKKQKSRKRLGKGRIALALFSLALFGSLAWIVWGKLRSEVFAYYTDDAGTEVTVEEDKARAVLWEDPKQNSFTEVAEPGVADTVNQPDRRLEAAFSPSGTMMVLVRWGGKAEEDKNADLYFSKWDGRNWSRPEPLTELNSSANDRGPAFSRDGRYLYFASDREGGEGGSDLYVARWDLKNWTAAVALGAPLNTAADELGPAPSADGSRLYFSSNRDGKGEDIFVAQAIESPEPDPAPDKDPNAALPTPMFAAAEPVGHLNSSADDLQAALTTRGDHVFLASDRDRDRDSGFGLYLSRVVAGEAQAPEKVDLYVKEGDATDPAVRMDGFDLLFSAKLPDSVAGEGSNTEQDYLLYRSTTREVFGYTDYTRWEQFKELMDNIGWWILLAIAAVLALIYLIEKWRDITSLFHKSLAGSAAVHLLILFLLALWQITKQFEGGGEPESAEISISIDALAQEQLALESTPEEVKITETPVALVTDRLQSDFKIPDFTPKEDVKTTPIVTSTAKTSLVMDVRQSKSNPSPASEILPEPMEKSSELAKLSETFLPEPEILELEELDPGELLKEVEMANPLGDLFFPTKLIPQVETVQNSEKHEPKTEALSKPTENEQVESGAEAAETKDTGGEVVVAHRGLEALANAPKLDGAGNKATTMLALPGADPEDDPLLPDELETPPTEIEGAALTELIRKQRGKPSIETIEQLGGSDATERAIGAALEWLSKNQEADGHWDTRKHGGKGDYDTASAGLALLCYYGWDQSHNRASRYQNHTRKAIDWLVAQQKPDGDLRGGGRMYCHGIAAIALCEAFGVSGDEALKEPAERAIAFILSAQSKSKGGWRYGPGEDADTSVTGWQYMAMHSARMAGIKVPENAFEGARRWLDHAGGGKHGGIYGYTGPQAGKPAMIATGMFCRQLDLLPPTDPKMGESAEALKMRPMNVRNPDFYYVYYGTLALYQHQGPIWAGWNERLKETLPLIQRKDGKETGSWDLGSGHGAAGGRVVSTAMATLSLEVYYRLLPMYGFRNKDAAPPKKVRGK
jgi:hypothetical protein